MAPDHPNLTIRVKILTGPFLQFNSNRLKEGNILTSLTGNYGQKTGKLEQQMHCSHRNKQWL